MDLPEEDTTMCPFISIVTPSFNQRHFIEKAIKSVADQNYRNYEHLIIDGKSTDGTVEVLEYMAFQDAHIQWISELDNGQSSALNKGFSRARGDIIGWLNSDDFYSDNCFDCVIEFFHAHPDVDIVYGDYRLVDENGCSIQFRRETEFSNFTLSCHRVLYIATIATFFRRRIFDEDNWINEDLHYAMDLDWLIRLARKGYVIRHIDHVLASYRLQPESKTCSDPERFKMEHVQVVCNLIPMLRKFKYRWVTHAVICCGRFIASSIRCTEKMLRGYYWPTRNAGYVY